MKKLVQHDGHGTKPCKGEYDHIKPCKHWQYKPVWMDNDAEEGTEKDNDSGNKPDYPFQIPFVDGCAIHFSSLFI